MTRLSGVEFRTNKSLFRGCSYYTTLNADKILDAGGLQRPPAYFFFLSRWARTQYWVYFLVKGTMYPYSIPLIYVGRWINTTGIAIGRAFKRRVRQQVPADTSTVKA